MDSMDPKGGMRLFAVSGGVFAIKAAKGRKLIRLYVSGIGICEELFECIRGWRDQEL